MQLRDSKRVIGGGARHCGPVRVCHSGSESNLMMRPRSPVSSWQFAKGSRDRRHHGRHGDFCLRSFALLRQTVHDSRLLPSFGEVQLNAMIESRCNDPISHSCEDCS